MTIVPLTCTVPRILLARIESPRPSTMKRLAARTNPTALLEINDTLNAIYTDVSPGLADTILSIIAPQGVRVDTDLVAFADAHPGVEQLIYVLLDDVAESSDADSMAASA